VAACVPNREQAARPSAADTAAGRRFVDRALIAYARGPEHPAKVRLLHWLIRRFAARRLEVRYGMGAGISIDPADYIGWAILRTGHYERASLDLVLRIMRATSGLFVDVGANFGWYSCAVAAIPDTTVVAIEPDCANCATLRENLKRSGHRDAIVINAAAGLGFDAARIARRAAGNSGTVAMVPAGEPRTGPTDWVAVMPLDALLRRVIVPPTRPAVIKIDVEGFEQQVLAGLDFSGPFRPRHIVMEYEPVLSEAAWGGLAGVEAFFATNGYEIADVYGRPVSAVVPEANIWARER
jgi:FkbM family methyltransferase